MFWGFLRNSWKSGSRLKIRFSAQISNYAKIPWNTQKTPTKHVLRLFEKFLKIWFSAQTSGSRLRCRTMLKIPWNTQKTPTKHVLRLYKIFLKILLSAKKSGSPPRCRTMLKNTLEHSENTNYFKKFLKIRFLAEKSCSRLRCRIMLKIPWNTQKTPTKHVLRLFKKFLKIRYSTQILNNAKIPWNTQKHQLNMCWCFLRNFWRSGSRLKHPVLGSDVEQC